MYTSAKSVHIFFFNRLDSFSRAGKLLQDMKTEAELFMPLLLNATYTAMNTEDLALRYSAVGFVRSLVDIVEQREREEAGDWFDILVVGCILPAVKEAVKSKQQVILNNFFVCLHGEHRYQFSFVEITRKFIMQSFRSVSSDFHYC